MRRKIAAIMVMAGLMAASQAALAKEGDRSIEASLNYGTETFDGLGGQIGATAGFGYQLGNNLQGRVDLSYFRSSTNQMGMNVAGTRVPIDLGGRYLFPLDRIDRNLTAFGQGGLEISFDHWVPALYVPSRSDTRFGGLIGAGAQYALDANWDAVLNLQYHVIEGGYLSTGLGMSYHF